MKFEIKSRVTGDVLFSCEIDAEIAGKSYSFQLGFAVKKAVEIKANLRYADLRSADLSYANLRYANLRSADLSYANLRSADLSYANLRYANLSSADLSYANLSSADLSYANLSSADLSYANLRSADLSYANLRYANLRSADLSSADLSSANLSSADLSSADLSSAKNSEYSIAVTRILPEGSIIGWKKLKGGVIAKLRIPEEAKRSHAFGRKCRAEYADVVELFGADIGISSHDDKTVYKAGERVMPDSFSDVWTDECAPGIHFFLTRLEAEAY